MTIPVLRADGDHRRARPNRVDERHPPRAAHRRSGSPPQAGRRQSERLRPRGPRGSPAPGTAWAAGCPRRSRPLDRFPRGSGRRPNDGRRRRDRQEDEDRSAHPRRVSRTGRRG
jgi:hypothetical protein